LNYIVIIAILGSVIDGRAIARPIRCALAREAGMDAGVAGRYEGRGACK